MKTLTAILLIISSSIYSALVKEVGKIDYDAKSNTFIFYFIKENKVQSVLVRPTDKKQFEFLKAMQNKPLILEGEVKPFVSTSEGFTYREEIENTKVQELNRDLLKINTKKIIAQYNLVSHERKLARINTNDTGIGISDKAANSVIGIGGVLVGIAAGPIAIVPAAAYLINEAINEKGKK